MKPVQSAVETETLQGYFLLFSHLSHGTGPRWDIDANVELEIKVKVDGYLVDADGDGEKGGRR